MNECFRPPSLRHDLLVATNSVRVVHHSRQPDGTLRTAVHGPGRIDLDPSGVALSVVDFYRGTGLASGPEA